VIGARLARLDATANRLLTAAAALGDGLRFFRQPRRAAVATIAQFGAWTMQWMSCWLLLIAPWIVGSALFSIYVGKFATYNKTYGSLGAVVVLLMWFWLSAYSVILGAELNAEMEHQTARDTTDRPRKPLGKRGAFVADTVAPRP